MLHSLLSCSAQSALRALLLPSAGGLDEAPATVIASGDAGMQQLLTQRVSWLELQPSTSSAAVQGLDLVTGASFVESHGFPPPAYADWLALAGVLAAPRLRLRLPCIAAATPGAS